MKKNEIRKLKSELKSDGKKQLDRLRNIEMETPESRQEKAVAKATAYVIEMRQNIVPARYPAATSFVTTGEKPRPLWMPHKMLLEKMNITERDLLFGVAFDDYMSLCKPEAEPYNEETGIREKSAAGIADPVDSSWPSFLNARKIAELCIDGVREAETVAYFATSMKPALICDTCTQKFREYDQTCIKSIYQVGRILYIDYENDKLIEGNPERDRMLYCHDETVEDLYRVDGILYRTFVYDYAEPAVVLSDPDIGVPELVKVMTYEELIKKNEPYRIAQWYTDFRRFDVKNESEWLDLFMQVEKEKSND